jgi:hypothetical protein
LSELHNENPGAAGVDAPRAFPSMDPQRQREIEAERALGVRVDADPVRAALEKLLRAEERYVRDTGLPQPDDLIQNAVNEARTVLGWPAVGEAGPADQAIYKSIADGYYRDTAGVAPVDSKVLPPSDADAGGER